MISSYINQFGNEVIPAIEWGTGQRIDPNRRDNRLGLTDRSAEYRAIRPRWTFNVTTGELLSRGYMASVEPSEVNAALAEAIQKYERAVKTIVLHLAPSALEHSYLLLQRCGFERCIAKEGEVPELIFVGPPRPMKWK
jgi:hypothetical protein